jgi:hypothetical protein
MSHKFSLLLLLLCCGACSPTPVNTSTIQPPKLLASLPTLATIKQAATVEIKNDWNGYSDITPVLRHYKLKLDRQQLVGNAHIAVGGYGAAGIRQQRTTKIKIPAPIVSKFLTTLSKTPLQSGIYKPSLLKKDDYPAIEIQLKSDKKQVIFSSQSQGVDRTPWKVLITENNTTKEYITNSPIPAQAFRILNPSLDRSGVDGIIHRRRVKKKK